MFALIPYAGACFFASFTQMMISPFRVPREYERTFGTYDAFRSRSLSARAFCGVTNASEMSHPGSTFAAMVVYAKRGTRVGRAKFCIETLVIRLAFGASYASGRIYFSELHKLVVLLAAYFADEGALVADIF